MARSRESIKHLRTTSISNFEFRISICNPTPPTTIAPPTNIKVPIMADHLDMPTEHYIPPANTDQSVANPAPMAPTAATTSGEIDVANATSGDTADASEHNGGVNQEDYHENHQENGVESATNFSDLISEGNEAIAVAANGLGMYTSNIKSRFKLVMVNTAPQFFYGQTPFGSDVPHDIRSGAVPFDVDYLAKWVEGGRNGSVGRAYLKLPMAVKTLIAFHTFLPGPREIRVVWSTAHKAWVYNSLRQANLVPFVVEGFEGIMKDLAKQVFEPAPTMSHFMAYQWFNYDLDTLFLDFRRCAATWEEKEQYAHALHTAIRMLLTHRHENPTLPFFKVIKFSYCPLMYTLEDLPVENTMLESVLRAHAVEIVPHEH